MRIYQYIVHSHPSNMAEGTMFGTIEGARDFAASYGRAGACISEVTFEFADSELVEDTRDERSR